MDELIQPWRQKGEAEQGNTSSSSSSSLRVLFSVFGWNLSAVNVLNPLGFCGLLWGLLAPVVQFAVGHDLVPFVGTPSLVSPGFEISRVFSAATLLVRNHLCHGFSYEVVKVAQCSGDE